MTRTEARVTAVLGTVFTFMILGPLLDEFDVKRLSIVLVIALWIPMLVVHELGHALAAKALGWRVREIVIGFGRELWRGQIGETRLSIRLAPVEGYVLPEPATPEGIRWKSALIYAAGPGAEFLVLGFVLAVFGWDTVFGATDTLLEVSLRSLAIVILYGAGFNLLPFRVEGGGVSDGLGILSSPFMPEAQIQLRLIGFELRRAERLADEGRGEEALATLRTQIARFPDNESLLLLEAGVLSTTGQSEAARALVEARLASSLDTETRLAWLVLKARIELEAPDPEYFTLDLALQKPLEARPTSPELLAIRGASWVRRGRAEEGGQMLADAWRRNDGTADAALILAWLTIAALRCRALEAAAHYREAFDHTNTSSRLRALLREEADLT